MADGHLPSCSVISHHFLFCFLHFTILNYLKLFLGPHTFLQFFLPRRVFLNCLSDKKNRKWCSRFQDKCCILGPLPTSLDVPVQIVLLHPSPLGVIFPYCNCLHLETVVPRLYCSCCTLSPQDSARQDHAVCSVHLCSGLNGPAIWFGVNNYIIDTMSTCKEWDGRKEKKRKTYSYFILSSSGLSNSLWWFSVWCSMDSKSNGFPVCFRTYELFPGRI